MTPTQLAEIEARAKAATEDKIIFFLLAVGWWGMLIFALLWKSCSG